MDSNNEAALICTVLEKYGLQASGIEQVQKGSTNRQYIIRTAGGSFFLRRYSKPEESGWNRIARTEGSILYEHAVLQHASDRGIPCIPPAMNKEGSTVTRVSGNTYSLFPYMEAEEYPSKAAGKGEEAAALLAGYHRAMSDFPVMEQRPNWGYAGRLTEWFHENEQGLGTAEEILGWMGALSPADETSDYLRQNADAVAGMVKMLGEEFPEAAYDKYPVVVNHGDYIMKNIGMSANGPVLFDFDFCVRELRIYDLSMFIAYTAGEAHTGKNVDMRAAGDIVRAYRDIYYMTAEELSLAPYMVIAFRLHILLGNLGILKTTSCYSLNLLRRNIEGLKWWMENRGALSDALRGI